MAWENKRTGERESGNKRQRNSECKSPAERNREDSSACERLIQLNNMLVCGNIDNYPCCALLSRDNKRFGGCACLPTVTGRSSADAEHTTLRVLQDGLPTKHRPQTGEAVRAFITYEEFVRRRVCLELSVQDVVRQHGRFCCPAGNRTVPPPNLPAIGSAAW